VVCNINCQRKLACKDKTKYILFILLNVPSALYSSKCLQDLCTHHFKLIILSTTFRLLLEPYIFFLILLFLHFISTFAVILPDNSFYKPAARYFSVNQLEKLPYSLRSQKTQIWSEYTRIYQHDSVTFFFFHKYIGRAWCGLKTFDRFRYFVSWIIIAQIIYGTGYNYW